MMGLWHLGLQSMQGQWWLSLPFLLPALTFLPRTLGPLAAWVPPPSLFPHSSLKIDVCILWNLHNKSDTFDTFKLLVLLGGVVGYECPMAGCVWTCQSWPRRWNRRRWNRRRTTCCAARISVSWPRWLHNILFCNLHTAGEMLAEVFQPGKHVVNSMA